MSRNREDVDRVAEIFARENPELGMVFLAVITEHPTCDGGLEADASVVCGSARTEAAGLLIVEASKRLRAALEGILRDLAAESGQVAIDREDLAIRVSGERPKA